MKIRVELRCTADDQEEIHPIACLERDEIALETLGLTIAEGKAILKSIQQIMVEKPLLAYVERQRHCPECGGLRTSKGHHDITLRTAFGNLTVKSPRLHHCTCSRGPAKTFRSRSCCPSTPVRSCCSSRPSGRRWSPTASPPSC